MLWWQRRRKKSIMQYYNQSLQKKLNQSINRSMRHWINKKLMYKSINQSNKSAPTFHILVSSASISINSRHEQSPPPSESPTRAARPVECYGQRSNGPDPLAPPPVSSAPAASPAPVSPGSMRAQSRARSKPWRWSYPRCKPLRKETV